MATLKKKLLTRIRKSFEDIEKSLNENISKEVKEILEQTIKEIGGSILTHILE